jgi:hypothetical protein
MHPEPELITNPVYRELPRAEWPVIRENSFLNNAKKILMTDDNMKPMHIEKRAENTEFHVIRGSDTLLIVVGESWTYGEALPGIGSGSGNFNFASQLEYCMGPRMAEVTGWDLYQFAIPGNCNLYMHIELDRILNHVSTLGYKEVKVVLQMTESSREIPLRNTKHAKTIMKHGSFPFNKWFDVSMEQEIDMIDWLSMYENIFLDHFHNSLNSFKACPIQGILWRNFCRLSTKKSGYIFKMIEPTMVTFTSKLVNHDHKEPLILNPLSFADYFKNAGKKVKVSRDFMEEQMDLIEKMFDYIKGDGAVLKLVYHNNHPSKIGHLVWAHHLIRQAGWKDI